MSKLQLYFILIFIMIFINSCSKIDSINGNKDEYLLANLNNDMVLINAVDRILSWSDVAYLDTANMTFSYNYYISNHEVTNQEFNFLMSHRINLTISENNYPVSTISWYDAILYCNELSKANGLDTVYQYLSFDSSGGGNVYGMDGLRIDYNVDGYRLPTEAEWLFAVTNGKSQKYPWGNDEALADIYANYNFKGLGSELKAYGSLRFINNLYDMPGSVMEWTNDWYGKLPDTANDYVGAAKADIDGSKVVKGGSYMHGLSFLQLDVRKDVYGNIPSTRSSYIGFRVARGVIDTPESGAVNGKVTGNFLVVKSKKEVNDFLEDRSSKLVFVNGLSGNLMYVDYGLSSEINEVIDTFSVKHPVISPDGKWVAFSTAAEGQIIPSDIYVRPLTQINSNVIRLGVGAIPRWWIEPSSQDTFLVYSSSAMNNSDSTLWSQEKTLKSKFSNGAFSDPEVVYANGSFNGGISKDGKYLATGSTNLRVYSESNGVENLFQSPENGKSSDASNQVCNVSMSGENSPRLSFIDFGYTGESSIVGSSYDIHEYLFISDIEGNIEQSLKAPNNLRWKHPEWAYGGNYLVSNIEDANGNNSSIYLQSLENNKSLEIIEGESIRYPYLWLGGKITFNTSNYDPNLFGEYSLPDKSTILNDFDITIKRFWQEKDDLEIAIVGSSRSLRIFPKMFSNKARNFSIGGANLGTHVHILNDYVLNHCDSLKVVIFSVGFDFWHIYNQNWEGALAKSYGYNYDKLNDFWKSEVNSEFLVIMDAMPKTQRYNLLDNNLGAEAYPSEGVGWTDKVVLYDNIADDFNSYKVALKVFEDSILKPLHERGIKLIGVQFPQSPIYATSDYYGRYGPKNSIAQELIDSLESLVNEYPNFYFMDEHNFGNHDYIDDIYSDEIDHLNLNGAEKISKKLAEFVDNLL